jgi:hypothetical protein
MNYNEFFSIFDLYFEVMVCHRRLFGVLREPQTKKMGVSVTQAKKG